MKTRPLPARFEPGRSSEVSLPLPWRNPAKCILTWSPPGLVGESWSSAKPSSFFFLPRRKERRPFALPGGSVPALLSPESCGEGRLPSWACRLSELRAEFTTSAMCMPLFNIAAASGGTPDPYFAVLEDIESVLLRERWPNMLVWGDADTLPAVEDGGKRPD